MRPGILKRRWAVHQPQSLCFPWTRTDVILNAVKITPDNRPPRFLSSLSSSEILDMKRSLPPGIFSLILAASFTSAEADQKQGKLIFQDDFERAESQEVKDEIGRGWGSNSAKRAGGNKQVDLRDGAMHIYMHPTADHAVSVTHPAEFRNGSVHLRFRLDNEQDNLGLNFADLKYKKVWAGHLFVARISTKDTVLQDLKTGNMDLEIRSRRQAKSLTTADQKLLKTKSKRIPHRLQTGQWYSLVADINDDTLTVSIDGKEIGSFTSEGIAHPTKRMLRLSVPREAVVDDVEIYTRQSD